MGEEIQTNIPGDVNLGGKPPETPTPTPPADNNLPTPENSEPEPGTDDIFPITNPEINQRILALLKEVTYMGTRELTDRMKKHGFEVGSVNG